MPSPSIAPSKASRSTGCAAVASVLSRTRTASSGPSRRIEPDHPAFLVQARQERLQAVDVGQRRVMPAQPGRRHDQAGRQAGRQHQAPALVGVGIAGFRRQPRQIGESQRTGDRTGRGLLFQEPSGAAVPPAHAVEQQVEAGTVQCREIMGVPAERLRRE
jgi:hypothetical protein